MQVWAPGRSFGAALPKLNRRVTGLLCNGW
jgi:hypothetical protein